MARPGTPPTFLTAGWYISFMNYAATGEGLTSCLAVAGSAHAAEQRLKERLPEYFHRGILTKSICPNPDVDVSTMIEWIPAAAQRLFGQVPLFAGHYFTELHYNLS
ncbi:hypothetical protein J7I44_14055 [Frateuria sp. MAH-13]|uniref:Uncharacterized protein n=1 Tax=Frateuria flava TaxID=2821489 RepID=A0ABS4DQU7_9GAMM|nr:hypothetical protein [Frateuria flava]MBP1475433.1 hypothetical protein [Frateuria flava]